MTQEVQPLAWQKRTNLEEHQQFFSKINEIIANLAPTVNEAEQAIAQATQAVASANAAVSTANAASEHANNASASAQQSAQTVAGYDTRLTAMENADTQNVKLDTNQVITGNKTFTKTMFAERNFNFDATAGDQWGGEIQMNSENTMVGVVQNFVSGGNLEFQLFSQNPVSNKYGSMGIHLSRDGKTNYCFGFNPTANAPSNAFATKGYVESTDGETNNLLHRTANETILSNKTIGDTAHLDYRLDAYGSNTSGSRKINIVGGTDVQSTAPSKDMIYSYMSWSDSNNNVVAGIRAIHNSDGSYSLQAMVLNTNGTEKYVTIAKGD